MYSLTHKIQLFIQSLLLHKIFRYLWLALLYLGVFWLSGALLLLNHCLVLLFEAIKLLVNSFNLT